VLRYPGFPVADLHATSYGTPAAQEEVVNDTVKRFLFLAVACVAAYVTLHVLRSLSVDSEARGLAAGATGYVVADLVMSRRSKRSR